MTVIAMPREMGTLGKDVAFAVAEQLGLEAVHHELVERDIAERMQVGQSDVHQFLEGTPTLWNRWKIDANKISQYTAEEMLELAEKGNVLIRGWGAVSLLRRVPHVLRIRVCAPMEFRVKVLMDRLGLESDDIARREITRNDKAHLRSAQNRNVSNWTNSTNFDLILNTERIPIADCVEQVKKLAESEAFSETSESKRILTDLLIETRIKNQLSLDGNSGVLSNGLEVLVTKGEVVLSGFVSNKAAAEKAYHTASATGGVKRVESNVTVIPSSYGP